MIQEVRRWFGPAIGNIAVVDPNVVYDEMCSMEHKGILLRLPQDPVVCPT